MGQMTYAGVERMSIFGCDMRPLLRAPAQTILRGA
jgi:hypothetical protein